MIDDMPAGAELDALIAEKVMDWKWERNATGTISRLVPPNYEHHLILGAPVYPKEEFSTDIVSAWQVVEKLSQDGLWLSLTSDWSGNVFSATFRKEAETVGGSYHWTTAPLAICRAALKAVEHAKKA